MANKNLWKPRKDKKIPWRQFNMWNIICGTHHHHIRKKCYPCFQHVWQSMARPTKKTSTRLMRIFEHLWKQENCHWGEFIQNCPSRKWLIQYGEHNMWNISPSMAIHEQKVIQTLVPNVQTMAKSKRNESTRKAKDKELKNQKKANPQENPSLQTLPFQMENQNNMCNNMKSKWPAP